MSTSNKERIGLPKLTPDNFDSYLFGQAWSYNRFAKAENLVYMIFPQTSPTEQIIYMPFKRKVEGESYYFVVYE